MTAQSSQWLQYVSAPSGAQIIWTEGDSYMAGAYGVVLSNDIRTATGRVVINSAIGGSTMAEILARVAIHAPYLKGVTTIIWDGSANSYGSVAQDLSTIDQILGYINPSKTLFLPPVAVGPSIDGSVSSYTQDMLAIYAGLVSRGVVTFDPVPVVNAIAAGSAQDLLDESAKVVCASLLVSGGSPHLTQTTMDTITAQIGSALTAAGI